MYKVVIYNRAQTSNTSSTLGGVHECLTRILNCKVLVGCRPDRLNSAGFRYEAQLMHDSEASVILAANRASDALDARLLLVYRDEELIVWKEQNASVSV